MRRQLPRGCSAKWRNETDLNEVRNEGMRFLSDSSILSACGGAGQPDMVVLVIVQACGCLNRALRECERAVRRKDEKAKPAREAKRMPKRKQYEHPY